MELETRDGRSALKAAGAHILGFEALAKWTPLLRTQHDWNTRTGRWECSGTMHGFAAHCLAMEKAALGPAVTLGYVLHAGPSDEIAIHCAAASYVELRLSEHPEVAFEVTGPHGDWVTSRRVDGDRTKPNPAPDAHACLNQMRPGMLDMLGYLWGYSLRRGCLRMQGRFRGPAEAPNDISPAQLRYCLEDPLPFATDRLPLLLNLEDGSLQMQDVTVFDVRVRASDELVELLRPHLPSTLIEPDGSAQPTYRRTPRRKRLSAVDVARDCARHSAYATRHGDDLSGLPDDELARRLAHLRDDDLAGRLEAIRSSLPPERRGDRAINVDTARRLTGKKA